jgi:hypothetical protein
MTRSKPDGWSAALNPRRMMDTPYSTASNATNAKTAMLKRFILFGPSCTEKIQQGSIPNQDNWRINSFSIWIAPAARTLRA